MNTYVVLLRGINVGGKNRMPMADLRRCLTALGFAHVSTYIASGNVILASDQDADTIRSRIEAALPRCFDLDDEVVRVLVLTHAQLREVVENKPHGFGEQPDTYHSDAIFLIGMDAEQVLPALNPREGVDTLWAGTGVIYSQRLSAQRSKSRLNKITGMPEYRWMTIRNWNTTTKLLELSKQVAAS